MNLKESIAHLKRLGWHVSKEGKKYRCHRIGHKRYCNSPKYSLLSRDKDYDLYSVRELIFLAKTFSSENNQNTAIKKCVKKGQKKERRIVRDAISIGDLDKIDELYTKKFDDVRNYD